MTQHLPLRQLLKLNPPQVGLTSLEVSNFYTLFFFYAAGMTVAVAYFMAESTFRKPRKMLIGKSRNASHVWNVHPASPVENFLPGKHYY